MGIALGLKVSVWLLSALCFFLVGYYVVYAVDHRRERVNLALQDIASRLDSWQMTRAAQIIRLMVAHDWDGVLMESISLAKTLKDPKESALLETEILSEFVTRFAGRDRETLVKVLTAAGLKVTP